MGYFANGTEGDIFDQRWCERCMHRPEEETDCPILTLHALWNYDQFPEQAKDETARAVATTKKTALDILLPDEQEGCPMFVKAKRVPSEQMTLELAG